MQQLLSVGKYAKFRKLLNRVYASLDNFFNQFAEVLLVRINKQDMNIVKNPRLAMFNLFSAAKDIELPLDIFFLHHKQLHIL